MNQRPVEDVRLGGPVRSSDGKLIGRVRRTLVDNGTFELRAIVVEEDRDFAGSGLRPGTARVIPDLVVPLAGVGSATEAGIELNLTAAEVRRLPPYLTYRQADVSAVDEAVGFLTMLGGNPVVPGLEETAGKPADEIEIDGGENVMLGTTGRKLGEVEEVLFDGADLVGIVMRPEGFFKHPVILPRRFIERGDDLALFAQLTEEDLKHLVPQ